MASYADRQHHTKYRPKVHSMPDELNAVLYRLEMFSIDENHNWNHTDLSDFPTHLPLEGSESEKPAVQRCSPFIAVTIPNHPVHPFYSLSWRFVWDSLELMAATVINLPQLLDQEGSASKASKCLIYRLVSGLYTKFYFAIDCQHRTSDQSKLIRKQCPL